MEIIKIFRIWQRKVSMMVLLSAGTVWKALLCEVFLRCEIYINNEL